MKLGDRVRVLRSAWGLNGTVGVIRQIDRTGLVGVQLDAGEDVWFFRPLDVELESRPDLHDA